MHIWGSNPLVYVYLSMHYPIDWIMRSNWWISFKRHMQGGSICFIFHYYDSLKSIWNQFNKVWESISEWKVLPFGVIETHRALPWPGFEPGLSRPQREVLTTIRSRPFRQLTTGTAKCGHIRHHTYLDFTTFVFITQEQKNKLWSGHKLKSFECIRCVMCNSLYL